MWSSIEPVQVEFYGSGQAVSGVDTRNTVRVELIETSRTKTVRVELVETLLNA